MEKEFVCSINKKATLRDLKTVIETARKFDNHFMLKARFKKDENLAKSRN